MRLRLFALLATLPVIALAQVPPRSDTGPAQPPTDIARSMCEALAGAERERCLAEQNAAPDRGRDPRETQRNCDNLIGPEREACLKKGGRIKAGMGATRPKQ